MTALLIVYAIIIALGLASMLTQIHYFANIAGFIGAIGLLYTFFKDRPDEESTRERQIRRYWYIACATGIFFSLLFGSLWNDKMGGMMPS